MKYRSELNKGLKVEVTKEISTLEKRVKNKANYYMMQAMNPDSAYSDKSPRK